MAVFNTGTTGKIHIEDTGSWINIYLEAGQSTTHVGSLGFSWSDPLGSGSGSISYPAGSGKKLAKQLGPFGPGQGGTVYFTMNATGTQGFGGPTSVSMGFSRASPPNQTGGLYITNLHHTGVDLHWSRAGQNGGSFEFDQFQISSYPQSGLGDFVGYYEITNQIGGTDIAVRDVLMPGRFFYWHVRSKNSAGWGTWSNIQTFTTVGGILVRVGGVWKNAVPYVKINGVWTAVEPFVRKSGVWTKTKY